MSSPSSAASLIEASSRSAFEEERQVLLNSMAAQLTQVVERMSKANDNLSILASNNSPVPDLAGLWQESYSSSRPLSADGAASGMVREDSSLSVFATEHGL